VNVISDRSCRAWRVSHTQVLELLARILQELGKRYSLVLMLAYFQCGFEAHLVAVPTSHTMAARVHDGRFFLHADDAHPTSVSSAKEQVCHMIHFEALAVLSRESSHEHSTIHNSWSVIPSYYCNVHFAHLCCNFNSHAANKDDSTNLRASRDNCRNHFQRAYPSSSHSFKHSSGSRPSVLCARSSCSRSSGHCIPCAPNSCSIARHNTRDGIWIDDLGS
jgi:hypothetical protein